MFLEAKLVEVLLRHRRQPGHPNAAALTTAAAKSVLFEMKEPAHQALAH